MLKLIRRAWHLFIAAMTVDDDQRELDPDFAEIEDTGLPLPPYTIRASDFAPEELRTGGGYSICEPNGTPIVWVRQRFVAAYLLNYLNLGRTPAPVDTKPTEDPHFRIL